MTIKRPENFALNRGAFIAKFIKDLEEPYKGFLKGQLDEIVMRNEASTGAPCFCVGDTVYARNLVIAQIGRYRLGGMAQLQPELIQDFMDFVHHYRQHTLQWDRFSQSLRVLMLSADSWQDLRDMFPDVILQPYLDEWGFKGLTRQTPDLQTAHLQQCDFGWSSKAIERYWEIKDQLAVYVGYRLL